MFQCCFAHHKTVADTKISSTFFISTMKKTLFFSVVLTTASQFYLWRNIPKAVSLWMFLDHTQLERHTLQDSSEQLINKSHRPYLINKQQTERANIHALSQSGNANPSKLAAVDLRIGQNRH